MEHKIKCEKCRQVNRFTLNELPADRTKPYETQRRCVHCQAKITVKIDAERSDEPISKKSE